MKNFFTASAIAALLVLSASALKSQNFPYLFSATNAAYMPIENAVSITNGMLWDDLNAVIPIGFDFVFFGQSINELDFSQGSGGTLSPVQNGENILSLLIAYGSDLVDRGVLDGASQSEILYKLEGLPGSRIFKIEWKNAGFYYELDENGTNNDYINLQLWLYEGSNAIEIRFGPNAIANNELVHDFASGPLVGLIDTLTGGGAFLELGTLYYLAGDTENPEIEVITDVIQLFLLDVALQGNPADGQIYRFAPNVSSAQGLSYVDAEVNVYPTAVQNKITIEWKNADISASHIIRVIDATGKTFIPAIVFSGPITELDVSKLPAGTYFVQVMQPDQGVAAVKKIIKS